MNNHQTKATSNVRLLLGLPGPCRMIGSRVCGIVCLFLLVQASGCGGAANSLVEENLARATLERTLEHWKSGGRHDDCQSWTPPVVVGASPWSENAKLLEYKIVEQRALDANLFVNVELTVEKAGRRETMVEQYCVGTDPVLTVFRSMSPAF
jgi:hypothetical protein